MQRDYIEDHFDEVTPALQENKPRTISIISMQVQDLAALTEDEQRKKTISTQLYPAVLLRMRQPLIQKTQLRLRMMAFMAMSMQILSIANTTH